MLESLGLSSVGDEVVDPTALDLALALGVALRESVHPLMREPEQARGIASAHLQQPPAS